MKKSKNLKLSKLNATNYEKKSTSFSLRNSAVLSNKTLSAIALASVLALSTSCSDDDLDSKIEYIEDTKIEGPITIEKLLENGWEVLQDTDLSDFDDSIDDLNEKKAINAKAIPLTLDHLKHLGYDTNTFAGRSNLMRDLSINSIAPIGVKFNQSTAIGKNHHLNYTQLGNVEIKIGEPISTIIENGVSLPRELSPTFRFSNPDNTSKDHLFLHNISETRTTSRTVTASASIQVGGSVTLSIPMISGISGGMNTEFTLGGSLSNTETKQSTTSYGIEHKITVPPKSYRDILIMRYKKKSLINYFVPIKLQGNVQTNFSLLSILLMPQGRLNHNTPITNYPNFARNVQAEEGLVTLNKIDRITVFIRKPVRLK